MLEPRGTRASIEDSDIQIVESEFVCSSRKKKAEYVCKPKPDPTVVRNTDPEEGKFFGNTFVGSIESQQKLWFRLKEKNGSVAIIPKVSTKPDGERDTMFEEENHELLGDDVYSSFMEADGSALLNDVPIRLKNVLPEQGKLIGVMKLAVDLT
jgi:hypothetical protein